jgi:hypothetical protein
MIGMPLFLYIIISHLKLFHPKQPLAHRSETFANGQDCSETVSLASTRSPSHSVDDSAWSVFFLHNLWAEFLTSLQYINVV